MDKCDEPDVINMNHDEIVPCFNSNSFLSVFPIFYLSI